MRVRDGAGERIRRVGLFDRASGQQATHHCLNLFLLRVADANHGLFDVVGRVLGDLKSRLSRREQGDRASMAKLERRGGILGNERLFDGDGGRPVLGNYLFQCPMQRQKTDTQAIGGAGYDDTVGDMVQPRTRYGDHPPAHPGEAWIESENANRANGHKGFVPRLFAWFNAP